MMKSLNILQNCAGYNHPDISNIYMNLGMMYQDADMLEDSIQCYKETLTRKILLFGESHLQVASCHQAIAHAYYMMEDFKNALDNQEKSHLIAKQLMPEDSEFLLNSKNQLNKFMQLSLAKEKHMVHAQGSREFGSNPKQ
jgi:tetratricopeptide (TPR) repeat protein